MARTVIGKMELDAIVKEKYYALVLKRAKEGRKLGINEMANGAGCSPAAISRWYRNLFIPGVDLLIRIEEWIDEELAKESTASLL
mgnify:CR=1 FL=1